MAVLKGARPTREKSAKTSGLIGRVIDIQSNKKQNTENQTMKMALAEDQVVLVRDTTSGVKKLNTYGNEKCAYEKS